MIGILGAMHEEIKEIRKNVTNQKKIYIGDYEFITGKLANKEIVLAFSGIGKVNSATSATLMISKFNINKLVFVGIAGSISKHFKIKDIIIGDKLIQHDFDVSSFANSKLGDIPGEKDSVFRSNKVLMDTFIKISKNTKHNIKKGCILTGDQFISDKKKCEFLANYFNGAAVEMEGAAVAQVCTKLKIPFLVLRMISDNANDDAKIDYEKFKNESNIEFSELLREFLSQENKVGGF